MEILSQIVLYFDRNSILLKFQEQCDLFLSLNLNVMYKFPPFRYILEIDVMSLIDKFPEIGQILFLEPIKFQKCCNMILFACLKATNNDIVENITINQIAVIPRLGNISPLMVTTNPRFYNGLNSFKGQLVSISKPILYVYHTVWSCAEECEGNEVVLQVIPKTPPKCYLCRSSLFENSALRRCGEQVSATFITENNVLPKTVKIVDDLISRLKLGYFYYVHIVLLKTVTNVWSMELIVPLFAPITTDIPYDLKELYTACEGVPWKFIYCLASTIGASICPLNCFMHLKINLLLSLASVKANIMTESRILHVLSVGADTGIVGGIMLAASKIIKTSHVLGTSNTSAELALTSSSGGICLMPLPLYSYSQKLTSAVLTSIESDIIVHDPTKIKLRTAVWAQGKDFKKIVVCNVGSIFGTVCKGDYGEYDDEIAEFIVERAINPPKNNNEELQAMKDIEFYIDIVAGLKVEIDKEAEILLRSYFLAARKERPRGVSVGSMGSLVTTCLTSARLCRRSIANVDDAVLAIWLHVSGCPEPRYAPEEYLQTPPDINKLQIIFDNFIKWLHEFTTTYGY